MSEACNLGRNPDAFELEALLCLCNLFLKLNKPFGDSSCPVNALKEVGFKILLELLQVGLLLRKMVDLGLDFCSFLGDEFGHLSDCTLVTRVSACDEILDHAFDLCYVLVNIGIEFIGRFLSHFVILLLSHVASSFGDLFLKLFQFKLALVKLTFEVSLGLGVVANALLFHLLRLVLQCLALECGFGQLFVKVFIRPAHIRNSLLCQLHFFKHTLLNAVSRVH